MSYKESNIQFDAVIPWVNGNDTAWQKKINIYLDKKIDFKKKKDSKRYNSIGEIDIAIKSIIKNASFFKTIYLVTDNQIPESFDKLKTLAKASGIELKLIDHSIIFKTHEQYLPTFNSRSIETLMYNIPHLSEHFVIFNDDVFILRKTSSSDFFTKNGNPVIRGKWKQFNEKRVLRKLYLNFLAKTKIKKKEKKDSNKEVMQNSAKRVGFNSKYFRRYHTPISIRKSTAYNFLKEGDVLKENIKHKFRNPNQFMISSLTEHLEIKSKTYSIKNTQLTYFRTYKNFMVVKMKLLWFDINKNKIFTTFQSLEMADQKTQNYILKWIDNKLNNPL